MDGDFFLKVVWVDMSIGFVHVIATFWSLVGHVGTYGKVVISINCLVSACLH